MSEFEAQSLFFPPLHNMTAAGDMMQEAHVSASTTVSLHQTRVPQISEPDDVLIKVKVAGCNIKDWKMPAGRKSKYYSTSSHQPILSQISRPSPPAQTPVTISPAPSPPWAPPRPPICTSTNESQPSMSWVHLTVPTPSTRWSKPSRAFHFPTRSASKKA